MIEGGPEHPKSRRIFRQLTDETLRYGLRDGLEVGRPVRVRRRGARRGYFASSFHTYTW